jgi:phage terminase large subunit
LGPVGCVTPSVLAFSFPNPGGVGHVWFRNRFVQPFQLRLERDTRFIPATIKDNSFTNPEYRFTLENLTGWQKRAWLEGDWDIAAGQYFTTFRREFHVVDDFPDGRGVEWVAGFDYGFNHYTAALLAAYDADRNLFIVDEHAARGWVPDRHAEAIQAMCQRHGVTLNPRHRYSPALSRFIAGRDLFTRQSNGLTIARQYADLGISLRPDHSDRVNGWAAILRGFGDPAAGVKPTLFIHRRCTRLLETIPCLQHDPNRPEDVLKVDSDEDGLGGDDAADALRYLVANQLPQIRMAKLRGL